MGCCACGFAGSNKAHPAGIAPSLARWTFEGRSLGLDRSALARSFLAQRSARLGHSLRRVGAGRRVLSCRRSAAAADPRLSPLAVAWAPSAAPPALRSRRREWACGATASAFGGFFLGGAHSRLRLDHYFGVAGEGDNDPCAGNAPVKELAPSGRRNFKCGLRADIVFRGAFARSSLRHPPPRTSLRFAPPHHARPPAAASAQTTRQEALREPR